MRYLVTGGCGFIGSAFVRDVLRNQESEVVNLDKLTYASNERNLEAIRDYRNYRFEKIDICNKVEVLKILQAYRPNIIINFAAESHVDNSILNATDFITTNVNGTFTLLECVRKYIKDLPFTAENYFKFIHISTDEVFGDLEQKDPPFSEQSVYNPSSPYSASKAASDHLVAAWHRTYGLPTIITNCSNNYGPYQNEEKLVPKAIRAIFEGNKIPLFGDGRQIRDWLFVDDHVTALKIICKRGKLGERYNIGGNCELTNNEIIRIICDLVDEHYGFAKQHKFKSSQLIEYVSDRPGHDFRYAINTKKINTQLGWSSSESIISGLQKTIEWHLETNNL